MLIRTERLKKYFTLGSGEVLHAVDGISLSIDENEVLGLIGESGSGKSTFGKALVGLEQITSGEAYYKDKLLPAKFSAADHLRYARDLQMIFQDPYSSLNPRMTVLDIVGEGLKIQRQESSSVIREQVAFWLTRVGLSADHMSRYPHEFSGGQRQRIGIARAMIIDPNFVVCDEPISALDVSVQAQVINLLAELKQSMGLTLLFIAHDLSMVRYVSDRIAVMYRGTVVETGPANDVFFNPKHPYTQILIASNPEPDPILERAKAHIAIHGEITSVVNAMSGCRFSDRCPNATEQCRTLSPDTLQVTETHSVACHLYS